MEKWIKTQEAAEISGYNIQHIRRLARGGYVNSRKWGKEWMIDRVSVMKYLENEGRRPRRKQNPSLICENDNVLSAIHSRVTKRADLPHLLVPGVMLPWQTEIEKIGG